MARRGRRHKGGGAGGAIFQPGQPLMGRKLKHASNALTNLEITPQANEYERLAQQLTGQGRQEAGGLERLGNRTSGTVSNAYRNMAQSAAESLARQHAIGNLLQQNAGNIQQQAHQDLNTQQGGALGSYIQSLGARGATGGGAADQALAQQAQAEQGRQAQMAQAAKNFASSQAGAYQSYGSGQAAASQQRGTEAIAGIQRDIANRIAQNNMTTSQNVQEARGKQADVLALKGPTRIKNLMDLRESERNFMLSGQAVGLDQSKLAAQQAHWARQDKAALIRANKTGSGSSSSNHPVNQTVISAAIQQAIAKGGGAWPDPSAGNARKQRAQFIDSVMSAEGVRPEWRPAVNKRIQRALRKHGW